MANGAIYITRNIGSSLIDSSKIGPRIWSELSAGTCGSREKPSQTTVADRPGDIRKSISVICLSIVDDHVIKIDCGAGVACQSDRVGTGIGRISSVLRGEVQALDAGDPKIDRAGGRVERDFDLDMEPDVDRDDPGDRAQDGPVSRDQERPGTIDSKVTLGGARVEEIEDHAIGRRESGDLTGDRHAVGRLRIEDFGVGAAAGAQTGASEPSPRNHNTGRPCDGGPVRLQDGDDGGHIHSTTRITKSKAHDCVPTKKPKYVSIDSTIKVTTVRLFVVDVGVGLRPSEVNQTIPDHQVNDLAVPSPKRIIVNC